MLFGRYTIAANCSILNFMISIFLSLNFHLNNITAVDVSSTAQSSNRRLLWLVIAGKSRSISTKEKSEKFHLVFALARHVGELLAQTTKRLSGGFMKNHLEKKSLLDLRA